MRGWSLSSEGDSSRSLRSLVGGRGIQDLVGLAGNGGLDGGGVDVLEAFFVICFIRDYSIEQRPW